MWLTPERFKFLPVIDTETGEITGHPLPLGIKKFAVGDAPTFDVSLIEKSRLAQNTATKAKNRTASAQGTLEAPRKIRQKAGLKRRILASTSGQTKTVLQVKARRQGKLCLDLAAHTSAQECAACGHVRQDHRHSQAESVDQGCENAECADRNASPIMAQRGVKCLLSGKLNRKEKKTRRITQHTKRGAESAESAVRIPLTLVNP